ncbi:MAG TPA: outer membrane protein assembly factor BamD [Saprospiraceae bacterium]|nr:outer membrane protein assembly factor BamD [Saprospiraceae bacterium]
MRFFLYFLLIISSLTACQSAFETVRTSNDPQRIYEEAMKYYDKKDYYRAQTLMELVLNQFKGTPQAEELFFKYSYTHFNLGTYELASTYFNTFASTFPYSQYSEEAEYMAAFSQYKLSPSYRLDQEPSLKAIDAFQDFANKYPESDRVPKCNELIDELRVKLETKAYEEGMLYYNLSQFEAAVYAFQNMLTHYPESPRAEYVRFLIFKASYLYAQKSIYDKRSERYAEAQLRYKEYISRYPKGKNRKEALDIYKQIELESKNLST